MKIRRSILSAAAGGASFIESARAQETWPVSMSWRADYTTDNRLELPILARFSNGSSFDSLGHEVAYALVHCSSASEGMRDFHISPVQPRDRRIK